MTVKCRSLLAAASKAASATAKYAPNKTVRVEKSLVRLDFTALETRSVAASHSLTLRTANDSVRDIRKVQLNAVGLQIQKVDGVDSWQLSGPHLLLLWDEPFSNAAETRLVTIDYRIVDPVAGMYFYLPDSPADASHAHVITDNEPEKARYWLPCIDAPALTSEVTFEITTRKGMSALANGRLVSRTDTDAGSTVWVWSTENVRLPSYLTCIAVGDFLQVDHGEVNGMPVAYIAPRGMYPEEDLLLTFGKTKEMVSWLVGKVGLAFPWPKYFQIVSPEIAGGAMENPSLVTWTDRFCCDKRLHSERGLLVDMVIVHEMAHTYFGDLIICRNFSHTWLKESWATCFEALWLEDHVDADTYRFELMDQTSIYLKECSTYTRPLVDAHFDSPWERFDMHAYPGGALRIHMLRKLLGDEAFWTGVRQYVNKFQGSHAETTDFQQCLEAASGLDLWIYGRGYPKIELTYSHDFDKGLVSLKAEQVQGKTPEFCKVFNLDIEVEITAESGDIAKSKLSFDSELTMTTTTLTLPAKTNPKLLRLDPEYKVLLSWEKMSSIPEALLLNNIAAVNTDITTRIWSYKELISQGSRAGMQAVHKSILAEPFWGVRGIVAEALSKSRTQTCVNILADMLASDQAAMSLQTIAAECKFQDPRIRSACLKVIKRNESPVEGDQIVGYRAMANVLECLASQHNLEDFSTLKKYATEPSLAGRHMIIRYGAFAALGKFGTRESYEFLLSQLQTMFSAPSGGDGVEPLRVLPTLISSLTTAAIYQSSDKSVWTRVVSLLEGGLRHPHVSVKTAVISALCRLEAKGSIGYMQACMSDFAHQDWVFEQRKIDGLKDAVSSKSTAELDKRVEELEGKLRALEFKVEEEAQKSDEKK